MSRGRTGEALTMARTVFGNELVKTFRKWRSYIAFIAIGIVVPLVVLALKLQGEALVRDITRGLDAGLRRGGEHPQRLLRDASSS